MCQQQGTQPGSTLLGCLVQWGGIYTKMQCCGAEIIYFRLRLLFGSTFVLNFGSGSSSGSSPSPVLLLKKGKFLCFNSIKRKLYYKSNIIRSISEIWLEVTLYGILQTDDTVV